VVVEEESAAKSAGNMPSGKNNLTAAPGNAAPPWRATLIDCSIAVPAGLIVLLSVRGDRSQRA